MNRITGINPLKTAFFIAIFEFFALLILPHLRFNGVLAGFVDGFFGALLAILFFNLVISKSLRLNMSVDNSDVYLKKLDLIAPSVACGIFLSVLFFVQEQLVFAFRSQIINDILTGFFATFLAMVICIMIYNYAALFTGIRLGGILSDGSFKIKRIEMARTSFFVALFELFILPFIGLFIILLQHLPFYIQFPLAGFFAGFIGCFIAALIYNPLAKIIKGISFRLEK
jgi:hypothetical protein